VGKFILEGEENALARGRLKDQFHVSRQGIFNGHIYKYIDKRRAKKYLKCLINKLPRFIAYL
jgi:hypothetical protein